MFICCAVIIVIIQYCNFCQLSYWMRSTLATLVGLALLAFLFIPPCRYAILKTHIDTVMLDISYFLWPRELKAHMQKDIDSKMIKKH